MDNSNDKKENDRKKPIEEEIFSAPTEVLPPSGIFPKLIAIKGEKPGQEIAINKDEMAIGRDLKADIKIRDTSVSKNHAVLLLKGDDVHIKDLNSANGTYLNGKRILPNIETLLKSGDKINIGKNQYEFESRFLEEKEFEAETEILPGQLIGRIRVLRGNIPFSDYDVRNGAILGKSEDCDIYIPDTFVTDEHAKITFVEGKAYITDLESSNGTFVNGRQIVPNEPHALTQNDKIKIGNVELQFEYFERGAEFEIGTQFDIRKTYGKLKAVSGSLLGWEYDVKHGLTFGRSEDSDVVIVSKLASENHAKIDIVNNKPCIVDLDSKNGTRVNGKNITRKTLYGGDKVEIGDVIFKFIGKRSVARTWVPIGAGVAIVIAAVVVGFFMYKASSNRKLTASHLNMANILFSEKRFDQAQNELQKLLEIFPKNDEAMILLQEVEKRKNVISYLEKARDAFEKEFYEDAKRNCDEVLYKLEPENNEARKLKELILIAESQKQEADGFFADIEKYIASKNYSEAIFLANLMLERDFESKYKRRAESLKEKAKNSMTEQTREQVRMERGRIRGIEKAIMEKYNTGLFVLAQEDIKRLLALEPNNRVGIEYSRMIEDQLEAIAREREERRIGAISVENIELAQKLLEEAHQIELDFLDYGKDIQPAIEKWNLVKEIIGDKNHRFYQQADEKLAKYSR